VVRRFDDLESKEKSGQLPDIIEEGNETMIARAGNPDTPLVPNPGITEEQREAAQAAAHRIRERAAKTKTGPFNWEEWKAYRDEGRR
jgi:hypothetical protein